MIALIVNTLFFTNHLQLIILYLDLLDRLILELFFSNYKPIDIEFVIEHLINHIINVSFIVLVYARAELILDL